MWTVRGEPPESPEAVALLREYFAELTVRYLRRATTEEEIDATLAEYPSTGLAAFFVLRADDEPAGCLGVHETAEVTRMYVTPRFRRRGGARALLACAEAHARARGLTRLFLDTRADLIEARALYLSCGFTEVAPPTETPGPFQDHWYEKLLDPSSHGPRAGVCPSAVDDGPVGGESCRMRVGVGFTPFETRADVVVRLAVRAEAAGVEAVGVAEGWTHDAVVVLAEVAQRTDRIRIGTSVLSVWGRSAATLAMGAAGLQRCSGGRFVLGLGAGSPPLTEGFHGVPWERPVDRLRTTLTAVRALLAGDRLPSPAGGARPLRLGVLPDDPVPVELAALSPVSVRLAGELADAWIPFLWTRSRLPEGRALVQEGEARGDGRPTHVFPGVPVALAADAAAARRLAAWWLATYTTRMGPLYPRMLGERFGMGAGVRAVVDAAQKQVPELPAAAEELAREATLLGTYDEAEQVIGAWLAAGADRVNLVLPPGHPEEELAAIVDVAGRLAASPWPRSPA